MQHNTIMYSIMWQERALDYSRGVLMACYHMCKVCADVCVCVCVCMYVYIYVYEHTIPKTLRIQWQKVLRVKSKSYLHSIKFRSL